MLIAHAFVLASFSIELAFGTSLVTEITDRGIGFASLLIRLSISNVSRNTRTLVASFGVVTLRIRQARKRFEAFVSVDAIAVDSVRRLRSGLVSWFAGARVRSRSVRANGVLSTDSRLLDALVDVLAGVALGSVSSPSLATLANVLLAEGRVE